MRRALPLTCLLLLVGCTDEPAECRFGAECASGVCLASGRCQPPDGTDAGPGDAGGPPDAGTEDAGTPQDGGAEGDAGPMACHDGDGRISRAELPLPLDESIVFRVATDVGVDTHGVERPNGTRQWDFAGPYAGDVDQPFTRTAVSGQWFATEFPTATYALPLSAEDDLLGVFELSGDELSLLGVVSATDGLTRTELSYDPPAPVWRFPLEVGAAWNRTSTISGLRAGVLSTYTEEWIVQVDASGDVGTADGVREVLRVNTRILRTVGLLRTDRRRHAFVEPCVGTVAQVFGRDGDLAPEPTMAAELWRVSP